MPKTTSILRTVAGMVMTAAISIGLLTIPTAPADALSGSQFDAGTIISDSVFFNAGTMDQPGIQAFIASKERSCAVTAGNPGCLKDYRESTPSKSAADSGNYCRPYAGAANELASSIIAKVAQACGINPQVLIVMLEKEQGLVSSANPTATRYRIAMGYGCPDTAACDTQYYGFFNQLWNASRQFWRYINPANNFRYQAGRNNVIQWHPNAACGSSTVFIANKATAILYNYTPYRPNLAALINLYGTGDGCSSYGNRNFWRYFSDWFGSPVISKAADSFVQAVYQDVLGRAASDDERYGWGKAIMNGMPNSQVAGGFVTSDEFRLAKIDEAYRQVLGREPDAAGRAGWLDGMRRGVLQGDDVYRIFMRTPEYYASTGGTDDSFVAAVYQKLLRRTAQPDEIAYWVQRIQGSDRSQVIDSIWNSVETARARVRVWYSAYLGRDADQDGAAYWGDLDLRYGDTWVRGQLIGSPEYQSRASQRYP